MAFDTVESRLLPIARAVSPYPYPYPAALDSFDASPFPVDRAGLGTVESLLITEAARERPYDFELRRAVSRMVIPSSRALLISAWARYATSEFGAVELETRMEEGSGVMIRYESALPLSYARRERLTVARKRALNEGGLSPSPFRHSASTSSSGDTALALGSAEAIDGPLAKLAKLPTLPFRRAFLFQTHKPEVQLARLEV